MAKKLKVAVLMGGKSPEHEVSVISALTVFKALDKKKYQIIPIYIAKDGSWYTGTSLLNLETFKKLAIEKEEIKRFTKIMLSPDPNVPSLLAFNNANWKEDPRLKVDVFLLVTHGMLVEDGSLQGLLELAGKPYTGPGVLAAAAAFDKVLSKKIFSAEGFIQTPYIFFNSQEWQKDKSKIINIINSLQFPVFVKPAASGSSIGVSRVDSEQKLPFAVAVAAQFDTKIIVEQAVVGAREINCTVIGDSHPQTAELEEVMLKGKSFHDYENKYISGSKNKRNTVPERRIIPAKLTKETTEKIKNLAISAFKSLNCSGIARVDFLLGKDGKIYLNEVNTIPGMLSSYFWQASGIKFASILDDLIEIARARHRQKSTIITSIPTKIF